MVSASTTPRKNRNRKAVGLCGFLLAACVLLSGAALTSAQEALSEAEKAKNQELVNQKLEEIKSIQAQISQYQTDLKAKQKEGKTLQNQIAIYDSSIRMNELEIRETKASIEKAELEMAAAVQTIAANEQAIVQDREALKGLIRQLYDYQQDSLIEILISKNSLSAFFNEVGAMESTQDELFKTVNAMKQEKAALAARNVQLASDQEDYQRLIEIRLGQNTALDSLKAQKNEMLALTQGEEGRYQTLVAQNQQLLPSLRAELRDLQSLGSDIKFDDAISAARYIGSVTGVRPALLLGVLRVESGLGTNVGGGTYLVDMNPNQREAFVNITTELGYDPNTMPVSKRPKSYSGWGGAMGPAQIMPVTWLGLRAEAAQLVKKSMADPWNLTDAVAALAVKLAKVPGVTAGNPDSEYEAAGIYLAGTNWRRFTFYPDKVMYYADLYQKELDGQGG